MRERDDSRDSSRTNSARAEPDAAATAPGEGSAAQRAGRTARPAREDAFLTRLALLAERPAHTLTPDERADVDHAGDVLAALASIGVARGRGEPVRFDEAEFARRTRSARASRVALEADSAEPGTGSPVEEPAPSVGADAGAASPVGRGSTTNDDRRPDALSFRWSDQQIAAVTARIEWEVEARVAAAQLPVARLDWTLAERAPGPAYVGLPVAAAVERAAGEGCAPWEELAVAAGAGRELWDAPCERWVELPAGLPRGRGVRYVALTVAGTSMAPLLHPGDVMLVRLTTRLARGVVAVVRRPDDGYVVKRVAALRAGRVELVSLNPAYRPIEVPRDESLVVGVVVARWSRHPDRLRARAEEQGA